MVYSWCDIIANLREYGFRLWKDKWYYGVSALLWSRDCRMDFLWKWRCEDTEGWDIIFSEWFYDALIEWLLFWILSCWWKVVVCIDGMFDIITWKMHFIIWILLKIGFNYLMVIEHKFNCCMFCGLIEYIFGWITLDEVTHIMSW